MMKLILICALILTFTVLTLPSNALQNDSPVLKGFNLSQEPPGDSLLSEQNETAEPLMLKYIANMGVLVSSGTSKIMIDCLFDKPKNQRAPNPAPVDSMMKGIPPFDSVNLVLVTHKDPDHFDAVLTVRYMETRPEPILVAPGDAVEEMHAVASDWAKIERRIISVDLKIGENHKKEMAGISTTIFRTTHGTSGWPMNLMYLVEVNGWRVFHEGDASGRPDDFLRFGLDTIGIDLAVVQYSWPLHPHQPYRRFFQESFKANHIALAHLYIKNESNAESRIDEVQKYYKDIFVLLPDMGTKIFRK